MYTNTTKRFMALSTLTAHYERDLKTLVILIANCHKEGYTNLGGVKTARQCETTRKDSCCQITDLP